MKSIALLFFLIGIIMIVMGICQNEKEKCPVVYQTQKITNNYLDDILSTEKNIFNNVNNIFEESTEDLPENETDNYIHNII